MAVEAVEDRGELVGGAADRPPGSGRVLEHEPQAVVGQLQELAERRDDELEPLLEARAEVGADVEHDGLRPDRRGRLEVARIAETDLACSSESGPARLTR